MSRPTLLKLVLLLTGVLVFGWGVRYQEPRVRWAGVGFMAAAMVLRIVWPGRRNDTAGTDP